MFFGKKKSSVISDELYGVIESNQPSRLIKIAPNIPAWSDEPQAEITKLLIALRSSSLESSPPSFTLLFLVIRAP